MQLEGKRERLDGLEREDRVQGPAQVLFRLVLDPLLAAPEEDPVDGGPVEYPGGAGTATVIYGRKANQQVNGP